MKTGRRRTAISVACVIAACIALQAVPACAGERPELTIGWVNSSEPGFRAEVFSPTVARLARALPQYRFRAIDIAAHRAAEDVRRNRADFILASSDIFWQLMGAGGQPLLVLKPASVPDANRSLGSTLVVQAERGDIGALSDLKGKTVSASLPDSLGGWLAMAGELRRRGFDPETFFSRRTFRSFQVPEVVSDVLNGRSDAGILSSCQLETIERDGLIPKGMLKVVNARDGGAGGCAHSTDLYPGSIFGSTNPHLDARTVNEVSLALLGMGSAGDGAAAGFSWQMAGRFDSVDGLYRTLQIGPWAYLRDRTLRGLWKRFRTEILAALGVLLLLLASELRLARQVRRKTEALRGLLEEKERTLVEVRRLTERLGVMERQSLMAQMYSMIAHELKQPVATILNHSRILSLDLDERGITEGDAVDSNEAVAREARRISDIVDRVRSYVKGPQRRREVRNLGAIARQALESLRLHAEGTVPVDADVETGLMVLADPVEAEILVLNLLKNASRAAGKVRGGRVRLSVRRAEEGTELEVADNGPPLDAAAREALQRACDGLYPAGHPQAEGLGLGLGIVRSIADSHAAVLRAEFIEGGGTVMRVRFPPCPGATDGNREER